MTGQDIRITLLGGALNLGLVALKLGLGSLEGSMALVADGVHSLSDLATDLVVLGGIRLGSRPADRSHAFGHGKYETMAGVLVALALIGAGAWLIWEAALRLARPFPPQGGGLVMMAVAGVSILAKEALYRATSRVARRVHSKALQANAWHHRSDALSSVAVLLGGATMALGYPVGDKVAAIVVGGMVLAAAASILRRAFHELLEGALSEEEKLAISQAIESVDGVQSWHRLRTRRLGRQALVDVHIQVDPNLSVTRAHQIATQVEQAVSRSLGGFASVVVHVEPKGEEDEWDG
ncbi:MAG: Cation diffusion facilitator family transporter [Acetothermia bacterium 64_32]|nr:MAG: Cation diffusion facilitator family transporter [Acetothermia bacterium 64_32]HAF70526.1 cation-efflux pump [Candidatus Acetothermia bacterium]